MPNIITLHGGNNRGKHFSMEDIFPQPTIVSQSVVCRPNDGEILVFGLDEKYLPWNWDKAHGQWTPWSDDQSKYKA